MGVARPNARRMLRILRKPAIQRGKDGASHCVCLITANQALPATDCAPSRGTETVNTTNATSLVPVSTTDALSTSRVARADPSRPSKWLRDKASALTLAEPAPIAVAVKSVSANETLTSA